MELLKSILAEFRYMFLLLKAMTFVSSRYTRIHVIDCILLEVLMYDDRRSQEDAALDSSRRKRASSVRYICKRNVLLVHNEASIF